MRAFSMLLSLLALCWAPFVTAQELPALGADRTQVSVSGLSSGGFMAVQYSVAWSSEVMGVGVVAGGLYNCGARFALSGAQAVVANCMDRPWSAEDSWRAVTGFARDRVIDPVSDIARQRVYLFSGSHDSVVVPAVMRSVFDFYTLARVPRSALRYVDALPASHAFVSAEVGGRCEDKSPVYVVQCTENGRPYDQPHAILDHIYGLKREAAASLSARPFAFDQRRYGSGAAAMANTGYAYVPADCSARPGCRVHVVFHGCVQSVNSLGGSDVIYAQLGYNRWADTNRIILLYPQVDRSATWWNIPVEQGGIPLTWQANPFGCWDWWGYSQTFGFQLRHGLQIDSVRRMVARLEQQP
ncbi:MULTISPECIES: extracellular catalytic domain type 2 short-chain-length polyhydroxyalkanoate depolymerase [Sphingomonas]|uniref:Poly(3-hydroxybutyrate) depolymerase n=1 Tax=Sphingomonas trueperi TaxID=53317 RepID=A0A7X5XZK1_9SPHN|nr:MULTISPECIES: depolymerase [Sphingomonas]NJB97870.1 poly(3-hydroxybutyrate) depolymerase [Sphingomonas trueperi]